MFRLKIIFAGFKQKRTEGGGGCTHALCFNTKQTLSSVTLNVDKMKAAHLTGVEDTGGQRRREALVQQQFAENHPGGLSREAPLQGA